MRLILVSTLALLTFSAAAHAQSSSLLHSTPLAGVQRADTGNRNPAASAKNEEGSYDNVWGLDVLISDGGFGLGVFYRRLFTSDLSGFVSFSVSEAKDEREVEQFDPYFQITYVPGKLNRFMVLPLMVGVQYRLFREDIVDTFRPYVNAGAGPAMIYQMPFVEFVQGPFGMEPRQVEFFKSIGRGHPNYTASAFVGVGANFGGGETSVFGVNFRYYYTRLFSGALPSLYNMNTFGVAGTKRTFGGFFITLNIGLGY
jgi:outer membrane protein W